MVSERFEVELTRRALKQLKSHPNAVTAVDEALKTLETEPESGHLLT